MTNQGPAPYFVSKIDEIADQYPTLAKALPRKTEVVRLRPGHNASLPSDKCIYIPFFYMALWDTYGQLVVDEKRGISKPLSWNLASAFFTDLTNMKKGEYFNALCGSKKYAPIAFRIHNGTFRLYIGQFTGPRSFLVYANKVKSYKAYLFDSDVVQDSNDDGTLMMSTDVVNSIGDFGHRAGNYMLQYTPFFLKKQYLEVSMRTDEFTVNKLTQRQALKSNRGSVISHGFSNAQFDLDN